MRFIILLSLLLVAPTTNIAWAADGFEKVTMPARGWPSDYDIIRAEKFFADENYEGALDTLQKVLNRNVKSIDAHALSGYVHFKLNNFERAEKHLFSVIDLDPRHMGAHLYLAEMDLKRNKIKETEERLQLLKMICEGTDCAEYQYLRSKLLTINKDK